MPTETDPLFTQLISGAPNGSSIASFLTIPPDIQVILDVNMQLNPEGQLSDRFAASIISAVQASLRDARTAPRLLTEQMVKERVDLCLQVFRAGYHEMNLSAIRMLDMMEELLFFTIIEQRRASDKAAEGAERHAWAAESQAPQAVIGAVPLASTKNLAPAEGVEEIEIEAESPSALGISATEEELASVGGSK